MIVDPTCTDEWCPDEPDYWPDDGGDSWDTFPYNGNFDGSVFADYHDDLAACVFGTNCDPHAPNSWEHQIILDLLDQLSSAPDPFCDQITDTFSQLVNSGQVFFYDNYIRARTANGSQGFLGGDAHPPNAPDDPYAGQLHAYDGSRAESAIEHTLVHEAAHFWGASDGQHSSSPSPFDWPADQIATYCFGQ